MRTTVTKWPFAFLKTLSFIAVLTFGFQFSFPALTYPGCAPLNDADFEKTSLIKGMAQPIALAMAPDGRAFISDRAGNITIWKPGLVLKIAGGKLPANDVFDAGMMGIALHPDFAKNGWMFAYFLHSDGQNRLARFTVKGDQIDVTSEKVILKVYMDLQCCHLGGSVVFGKDGELFLSTGENTAWVREFVNLDASDPLKDARRSAGNTNDLRGKILRIKPIDFLDTETPTAGVGTTYTIPTGNLFAPGLAKTRPEIYTMGHRNPYRITVDKKTGWLLWGEIGSDALTPDPSKGPAGYDEFNVTAAAGNFGWPMFVADNKPYVLNGKPFDATVPKNESPHNTGLVDLPPARPAALWYNYAGSPALEGFKKNPNGDQGDGARCAMAGPLYRYEPTIANPGKMPPQLDGKWIVFDWSGYWFKALTLDATGKIVASDSLFSNMVFRKTIDAKIGSDGALYVLDYGTQWDAPNKDAGLSKISFKGNCISTAALPGLQPKMEKATKWNAPGSWIQIPTNIKKVNWFNAQGILHEASKVNPGEWVQVPQGGLFLSRFEN